MERPKKAVIIYLSKSGTTKYFAHNIGKFLEENNIQTTTLSMQDAKPDSIDNFDYVLLGCWTSGLFLFLQHPEKQWVKFAKELSDMKDKQVILFTTYKLATGSMFKKMEQAIQNKIKGISSTLKAKGELLKDTHKSDILSVIN